MTGLLETGLVDPRDRYVVMEQIDADLLGPVFVGDVLLVMARVATWSGQQGRISFDVEVRNQHDVPVLVGTAAVAIVALTARV